MKTLFLLICFALFQAPCPCLAGKDKAPAPEKEPVLLAAIKRIARGAVLTDRKAENVSLSISPTKAKVSISF